VMVMLNVCVGNVSSVSVIYGLPKSEV